MHIISSSRKTHYVLFTGILISSFQINTICPFHRNTQHVLYSEMHIISTSQKYSLYTLLRNAHYILFQENTLYPLHGNTYILFSDKHTISTSQKYTLYTILRNAHYILFSDKHTIFSSQKCTLYPIPGRNCIST